VSETTPTRNAMTDPYWKRLVEKNPNLADEKASMTISVAQFRKAIEKGWLDGFNIGRQYEDAKDTPVVKEFEGILGRLQKIVGD
jgi:hypothetical protein